MVTERRQNKKLRERRTPGNQISYIKNWSGTFTECDSCFGALVVLFQQEQMVMLRRCKGKKRMVHMMQNQQVRIGALPPGAENVRLTMSSDDELVELV